MAHDEIVGPFRKSSFSGQQDNCVEVAPLIGGGQVVRDSKKPTGPVLKFAPAAWSAFVKGVANGEFNR